MRCAFLSSRLLLFLLLLLLPYLSIVLAASVETAAFELGSQPVRQRLEVRRDRNGNGNGNGDDNGNGNGNRDRDNSNPNCLNEVEALVRTLVRQLTVDSAKAQEYKNWIVQCSLQLIVCLSFSSLLFHLLPNRFCGLPA